MKRPKPVVLAIMDGVGIAPPSRGNAFSLAKTPNLDKFITNYFTTTIQASSEAVGLPWGRVGGSEVGHLNIGSGKIIYQSLPRINRAIWDGSFFENPAFIKAIGHVKKNNSALHLTGLISAEGIHGHIDHFFALLELAKKQRVKQVYIHAILDGRDAPFNSGINFVSQIQEVIKTLGVGKIATLSGRYYAMDRDNFWERIEKAYKAMADGQSEEKFTDPLEAIRQSYGKKVYDEEFAPCVIVDEQGGPVGRVRENDAMIFFNFRSERCRELTKAFVLPTFVKFDRPNYLKNLFFVTMTEYEGDLPAAIAFGSEKIEYPLARILSEAGLKQLHISETQKYAHVTFFFNGGREEKWPGEDWVLIPSPRIASFDQKPEMAASEITKNILKEVSADKYDFIVVNFANGDMVGHTGNLEAAIKAVEVVDHCLGKIAESVLEHGGVLLITADHGNVEEVIKLETGSIDKEHTTNPVPFILVGKDWQGQGRESVDLSGLTSAGVLADITPTILKIMDLKKNDEMTGTSLI